MAVKRGRQSCSMEMMLLQVDALVVVVCMGVGTCARVRGASECLIVCVAWMMTYATGHTQ